MSIEEIELLEVADVELILKQRILDSMGEDVSTVDEWDFDPLDLEAELEEYKAELIADEESRLAEIARVQDLKDRVEALHDLNMCIPEIPNKQLHIKKMIMEASPADAEAELLRIEAIDAQVKAERDQVVYMELRKKEYPSIEEIVVAIIEEDQNALDDIKARRQAVKTKYPKP